MRFSLASDNIKNNIRAYAQGAVTVNDEFIYCSVIVTPEQLIKDWPPQCFAELEAPHFVQLQILKPEIVILGTGARQQFPHPRLTHILLSQGIGLEVMDTAAACRTYNIIMSEGRQVAAALLMI